MDMTAQIKYVVKYKSAKLFMTYAVGKLEAALIICKPLNIRYKQSELPVEQVIVRAS